MSNIIREDVIKLGWDIDSNPLVELQKELNAIKKMLKGDFGDEAFEDIKKGADDADDAMKKAKKSAKDLKIKLTDLGQKGAMAAFKGLKKLAGISLKALTVGITGAATAIGALVTKSVSAYANYEQLVGGVDTLFKESSSTVQKYAKNAYKTAGLSANAYMETATSFSASLIQSLGGDTKKAAEYAHIAITDMSDNANKMGTDMSSLQYAYQGFAKQNYTMLDNLKLGYGGTKEEMKRLVQDAAKIDKSIDANSLSYANIVQAIHTVQKEMGIAGTTAAEAEGTITGSLNSVKGAWENLLVAVASGDEIDGYIDDMTAQLGAFLGNMMPVAEKALVGFGTVIEKLAPIIEEKLPSLAQQLLPPLIKAAVSLTKGLIKALPSIIKTLVTTIVDIFGEQFPIIKKIGDFFSENAGKIAKIIPVILAVVAAFKAFKAIKSISSVFSFGGKSGGGAGNKSGGLFGFMENLAKMKTTTILKGMANLAIILGGFIALTAIFMKLAPALAQMGDLKSIIKTIAIVGLLGALGTMLVKFANIAGKIPVSTTAKGLANMAIIIAGLTALVLLIGAASLLNFNYTRMLGLIGLIGALGLVGTALGLFAGILGIIPIPVVLIGLANMALVITGMTGIIVAFGALSKIKGFNEFITSGGETLANLFNIFGKIAGSLIGGVGEGLTESLPKIGENLSKFAESIKPMFDTFKGVDMSGLGSFFSSLGGFMLMMTGNDILSFFTGGTDYAELGTQLTNFATNSQGFFNKVTEFPESGFTNAKKLFECLGGIKSLPKEGGVVGWFMGNISYENIAKGLGELSSENIIKFFNTVAELKQEGFDSATALFECLAGLKSLPKEGGVVGWFAGEVNYENIANGLGHLSGSGVKKFFEMTASLSPQAFENTSLLFETLSGIKSLPKEGGFWQNLGDAITGKETKSALSVIADDLSNFASKTGTFFTQVNSLNLANLNGLWESLNKPDEITTNISNLVDENIADIVDKISKLPKKMGDALKASSKDLSNSMVEVWKEAIKASVAPVNKLLSGANHILKEFGSKKKVIEWTPYARGTNGHKGGNALVNDGNGAELVQMPNGKAFIPRGRNVFIPNAPKGMKVLSAENTAKLFGKNSPTFRYAKGTGDIDIWSFIDDASGLVSKINETISYKGMSGLVLNAGESMVSTFSNAMTDWIDKLFKEEGGQSLSSYVASKGVTQWTKTVVRALKMEGQYSLANVARTLYQMQTESGGNPRAINLWDSNAKKGIPSKGLMQVIDPTFNAYARKGFDTNIYDPLSNILASIRYAVSKYGSLANAYRGKGYSNGGIATSASVFGEDGAEMAIPLKASKRKRAISLWGKTGDMLGLSYTPENSGYNYSSKSVVEYNTYSPSVTITVSGASDDRTLVRKIKKAAQEAINDVIDGLDRNNPKVREV